MSAHDTEAASRGIWHADRPYRVAVKVDDKDVNIPNTPCPLEIDFGRILVEAGVKEPFDYNSVVVVRRDGQETDYSVSEHFRYGDRGQVRFLIKDISPLDYHIYFDTHRGKYRPDPDYIPAIGVGDELYENTGEWEPAETGGFPQLLDLTGDGTPDLIGSQFWGNMFGWPYNVIWGFPNAGEEDKLKLGDYTRVRIIDKPGGPPHILSERFYVRTHFVDWNRDGNIDMITIGSEEDVDIKFYENAGKRDPSGFPIFRLHHTVPAGHPPGYKGVGAYDFYSDGWLHLVVGGDEQLPGHETEPYTSYLQLYENIGPEGTAAQFAEPVRLKTADGKDIKFEGTGWDFCMYDLDGDGRLELIFSLSRYLPHQPKIVWYKRVEDQRPVFEYRGGFRDNDPSVTGVGLADAPGYKGLILGNTFYEHYVDPQTEKPRFRNPQTPRRRTHRVKGGGQPWPCVCDWRGHGGPDILADHDLGHVEIFENLGTRERPVYSSPKRITSGGKPIRIWRDGVFGGHHWHGMSGYTAPVYADWDGDGLPDLVVANETNRVFWFRNLGTRENPEFGERQPILVEEYGDSPERVERSRIASTVGMDGNCYPDLEYEPFEWRQRVAVVDWDGDGLPDLVAFNGIRHLWLYKRYRDPETGELKLKKGKELCYTSGDPITYYSLHRKVAGTDLIEVCDWDGDGNWDVLIGTCYNIFYLHNEGTNDESRFAPPVKMKLYGEVIDHSRHGLGIAAVDWDGNGHLDLFCGTESRMYILFRHAALEADAPPGVETGLLECRGKWVQKGFSDRMATGG